MAVRLSIPPTIHNEGDLDHTHNPDAPVSHSKLRPRASELSAQRWERDCHSVTFEAYSGQAVAIQAIPIQTVTEQKVPTRRNCFKETPN